MTQIAIPEAVQAAIDAAIQAGNLAAFRAALEALPRLERPTAYESAAQAAVRADASDILEECLRVGNIRTVGLIGSDLALTAAHYGTPAAVARLHDYAGLDVRDPWHEHTGANFLNAVVSYGNLPLLKYLIRRRGYTLDDFGPRGHWMGTNGPLSDAIGIGRPDMLAYLLRHNNRPERLMGLFHLAAQQGDTGVMTLLLERRLAGLDDIARASWSHEPGTPLHSAAGSRNMTGLRYLLDAGADVAKRDPKGRDIFERSTYLSVPERAEWPELEAELRQRGLLELFGRQ